MHRFLDITNTFITPMTTSFGLDTKRMIVVSEVIPLHLEKVELTNIVSLVYLQEADMELM